MANDSSFPLGSIRIKLLSNLAPIQTKSKNQIKRRGDREIGKKRGEENEKLEQRIITVLFIAQNLDCFIFIVN